MEGSDKVIFFQVNTSENSAGAKLKEIPEKMATPLIKNVLEIPDMAPERILSLNILRADTATELMLSDTEMLFPYKSVS
jgi:hypothetical protein